MRLYFIEKYIKIYFIYKNILYYLKEGKEDGYLWLDVLLSENFNLELL